MMSGIVMPGSEKRSGLKEEEISTKGRSERDSLPSGEEEDKTPSEQYEIQHQNAEMERNLSQVKSFKTIAPFRSSHLGGQSSILDSWAGRRLTVSSLL